MTIELDSWPSSLAAAVMEESTSKLRLGLIRPYYSKMGSGFGYVAMLVIDLHPDFGC